MYTLTKVWIRSGQYWTYQLPEDVPMNETFFNKQIIIKYTIMYCSYVDGIFEFIYLTKLDAQIQYSTAEKYVSLFDYKLVPRKVNVTELILYNIFDLFLKHAIITLWRSCARILLQPLHLWTRVFGGV
jgi:hypothetical protein